MCCFWEIVDLSFSLYYLLLKECLKFLKGTRLSFTNNSVFFQKLQIYSCFESSALIYSGYF